ncbi:hypothetical protein Pfo_004350 [Paulownia fortunei]|nr:hypothetical protein Pfo_004350 [Paulownia fortunei]
MCAHCILALCCHSKRSSEISCAKIPVCPFSNLSPSKPRRRKLFHLGEGSSSFRSLSSLGSFGRLGRNTGKVAVECNKELDKP